MPCRTCGQPKDVSEARRASLERLGGPLCHPCRRTAANASETPEAAEIRRAKARERARLRYAANPERWADRYRENRDDRLGYMHAQGLPCRGCGTYRAVAPDDRERLKAEGGPLCRKCRRAEKDELDAALARIRERLLVARAANAPPRPVRKGSGRSGTGNARYRRNRLAVLTASDICGICGHGGSATADHIVSARRWPKDSDGRRLPGFDDVENLQPAHGTMGSTGLANPCPVCGRLCNQSKGSRVSRTRADPN